MDFAEGVKYCGALVAHFQVNVALNIAVKNKVISLELK